MKALNRVLRAGEKRSLNKFLAVADQVNTLEAAMEEFTDDELRQVTGELRQRYQDGETLQDLRVEAFAAVREAAKRALGQRHYDVQIAAASAMCDGYIVQMRTGEGKTLAATLAAYTQSLAGRGVHVVTVNDYLAERDADWMGRVYRMLDTHVGVILETSSTRERQAAYQADITYGTNNEFGFDYLRDHTAVDPATIVQRGHAYAIVDEADSILIDEARTPLIISSDSAISERELTLLARLVADWQPGDQYTVDIKQKTVGLLPAGIATAERKLGVTNLYDAEHRQLAALVTNATRAHALFHRDVDYVVVDGNVVIVDEHTGRPMEDRRYNDGLHQAIEAKERVAVKPENQTVASVTLQNYFRMYDHLSGMSGTAVPVAGELHRVYKTPVIEIPTHRPMIRVDHDDVIFNTRAEKFRAVADEIASARQNGQPVLVGCGSVAASETLSELLHERHIPHRVLNAKHDAVEAAIVANAGSPGAVTVATNMAGRGTDIMLGGSVEDIAATTAGEHRDDHATWVQALANAEEHVRAARDQVVAAGGLYVIGTERHESVRIDDQLRGRAGRQGDPGQSRFFVSLDDPLLNRFRKDDVQQLRERGLPENGTPLTGRSVTQLVEGAQTDSENRHALERRYILRLDDVVNAQRLRVYRRRRELLNGDLDTRNLTARHIESAVTQACTTYLPGYPEDWDLPGLEQFMQRSTTIGDQFPDIVNLDWGKRRDWSRDNVRDALIGWTLDAYSSRIGQLGDDVARQVERQLMLEAIDRRWQEHLTDVDYLQQGFAFHGISQRDPFVQFSLHAHEMFTSMQEAVARDVFESLFTVTVTVKHRARDFLSGDGGIDELAFGRSVQPSTELLAGEEPSPEAGPVSDGSGSSNKAPGIEVDRVDVGHWRGGTLHTGPKIPRNAPCPCGSGLKYKKCHGRPGNTPAS